MEDLEIGAVDELLVGVSVVRDKDKEEKKHSLEFSSSFETLHFIMTNNNSLFPFIIQSSKDFLIFNVLRLLFRA